MNFECKTNCNNCKLSKTYHSAIDICQTFNKWNYLQSLEAIFWSSPKFYENLKNASIEICKKNTNRAWLTKYQNEKYLILLNSLQIQKEAQELWRNYEEYFYETLFHEYTHTLSMNNQNLKENFWTDKSIRGFTLLFEYFAQAIAQQIISLTYNKKYQEKECKLEFEWMVINKNISNLFWYGEIEPFALKFSQLLYWHKDWERMIKDYLNGNLYNLIKEKIQKNKEFLTYLHELGNIIVWDYIQQWYLSINDIPKRFNKEHFKKAVASLKD